MSDFDHYMSVEDVSKAYRRLTDDNYFLKESDQDVGPRVIEIRLTGRMGAVGDALVRELEVDNWSELVHLLVRERAKKRGIVWDVGRFELTVRGDITVD